MTSARTHMLARLRRTIRRLEDDPQGLTRTALGHLGVDAQLQGGLARGVLHEIFASGRHGATAAGFAAGLAQRLCEQRPLLWIRQNFVNRETGALRAAGLHELGLNPRNLVHVHAHDASIALSIAADALACDALGAVVLDIWGEAKAFNLVASRKLTLAAQTSRVTCLALRIAAPLSASTAETRWLVRAASSIPATEAWGNPVFDAELVRHRHGQTGRWIMEWNRDEGVFRDVAAHPQPVAAAPANRPPETADVRKRRTG